MGQNPRGAIILPLATRRILRHIAPRKVGFGQISRQPGQVGNEAAATSLFWVIVSTFHLIPDIFRLNAFLSVF